VDELRPCGFTIHGLKKISNTMSPTKAVLEFIAVDQFGLEYPHE
jgi:hypothetical protein